jgi:hypothetical protein
MGGETISGSGEPGTREAEAVVTVLNHSAERGADAVVEFPYFHVRAGGGNRHDHASHAIPGKPAQTATGAQHRRPLAGFGFLYFTPVVFVAFHFYLLLNLVFLARAARNFEDALERATPEDGEAREAFACASKTPCSCNCWPAAGWSMEGHS